MAKLEVKFSTAEMLLITSSMKITSFPYLDDIDKRYSEDDLKVMLKTARDSLMARGLVRIQERGDKDVFDLHPVVKAAVGVATRPEKGWWLTVTGENVEPRSVFFSWTENLIISNWVEEGIFCFKQVAEEELQSEILGFSIIDPSLASASQTSYEIPIQVLDQIVEGDASSSLDLQRLVQAGVAEHDAGPILKGIHSPLERCILIGVTHMREQSENIGLIVWFTADERVWLIQQAETADHNAVLREAGGQEVLSAITSLVTDTLSE